MSALAGFDCRDWPTDLFVALEQEVGKARGWSTEHELLALIADRVGVTASGQKYEVPVARLRRPGESEEETEAAISPAAFTRLLITGGEVT